MSKHNFVSQIKENVKERHLKDKVAFCFTPLSIKCKVRAIAKIVLSKWNLRFKLSILRHNLYFRAFNINVCIWRGKGEVVKFSTFVFNRP